MRKEILFFITIAAMMLFSSCSNEESLLESHLDTGRVLSLEATMPGVKTRVGLEQKVDNTISLSWEDGDQLELVIVQDGNKFKDLVAITNISPDKKKANFNIVIPNKINTELPFNIYGVHGGGGLSDGNYTEVKLPENPGDAVSLDDISAKKHMMLYFISEVDFSSSSTISVAFKHLGSLFNISLKNTSGTENISNIQEVRLVGVNGADDWAYNTGVGGNIFDLEDETFKAGVAGNYISFKPVANGLASGSTMVFWGWYPPLPDKNWPELKLELINDEGTITSVNTKPARDIPTVAGKSFYLFAEWDGVDLQFTDEDSNVIPTLAMFNWDGQDVEFDKAGGYAITILSSISKVALTDLTTNNKQYSISWTGGFTKGEKTNGELIISEKGKERLTIGLSNVKVVQSETSGTYLIFGDGTKEGEILFERN